MKDNLMGYPSIDKPWLKYYSEEAIQSPLPKCTAYELIHFGNEGHLNDVALIYFDRKISYRRMFDEIESTAKAFYSLGIEQGDVVILCVVNMPETIYALYALNRIGATANLIDPRTSAKQLHNYITECNAKLVVTVDLAYSIIQEASKETMVERIVTISPSDSLSFVKRISYRLKNKATALAPRDMHWADFIAHGVYASPKYIPYEKNHCFVIAHTGGTTGTPKGVMLSDDNFNAVAHGYKYLDIPFERQHKYFDDLPPFIVYGLVLAIHTTLCYGLQVILYPKFDSKGFPKLFKKYKPNHFSALSDHLKYLAEDSFTKDMNLSFLISAGVGGDALNIETERMVNEYLKRNGCSYEVVKGYGMTEVCATSVVSFRGANAIGSVGIPLVSNTIKIVDLDTGKEFGYDQIGEIWISAPSSMLGYYKNPKETNETIIIDENGTRWVKTGDLGRMNSDGLLFHEGRIRRIYLTTFEGLPAKIFPREIENTLKELPDVLDCTVVGRFRSLSAYYEPVAFVIPHIEHKPLDTLTKEMQIFCSKNLPNYMRPVEYLFVEEFPKTPVGKVDFRALERMAER